MRQGLPFGPVGLCAHDEARAAIGANATRHRHCEGVRPLRECKAIDLKCHAAGGPVSRSFPGVLASALPLPLLLLAMSSQGASLSLGTHFGVSTILSDVRNSGNSTVVAWPANAFAYQPGLRVGVGDARHPDELVLDSGLFLIDEA